jgi:hypothetical protein
LILDLWFGTVGTEIVRRPSLLSAFTLNLKLEKAFESYDGPGMSSDASGRRGFVQKLLAPEFRC